MIVMLWAAWWQAHPEARPFGQWAGTEPHGRLLEQLRGSGDLR